MHIHTHTHTHTQIHTHTPTHTQLICIKIFDSVPSHVLVPVKKIFLFNSTPIFNPSLRPATNRFPSLPPSNPAVYKGRCQGQHLPTHNADIPTTASFRGTNIHKNTLTGLFIRTHQAMTQKIKLFTRQKLNKGILAQTSQLPIGPKPSRGT